MFGVEILARRCWRIQWLPHWTGCCSSIFRGRMDNHIPAITDILRISRSNYESRWGCLVWLKTLLCHWEPGGWSATW